MKTLHRAFSTLFLLLFASSFAWAVDLPRAKPEEVGLSSERLAAIDRFYADKVDKGEIAGVVLLVARHGRIAHFNAIGFADNGSGKKLQNDSIFRLYSMTKPITATALMLLYEEGKFQLDDPISTYIPEFKGIRVLRTPESPATDTVPAVREPTIHDLFRHTAGLAHGGADYVKADLFGLNVTLEDMTKRLAKIPLRYQPGTKWEYSMGQDVQARLIEILSGMSFDAFLERRLFGPLGMKDTAHWVKPDKASRLAAVHWSKDGKLVPFDDAHGYPKPEANDFLLKSVNRYTENTAHKGGSFGLVGTTEDYWRFAQMMLNGGVFNGHRFLSPLTVNYITRDHLGPVSIKDATGQPSGRSWGLGFGVTKDAAAAGEMLSEGSFFWGGAAATFFWVDPKEDLVVVEMTQHLVAPQIGPSLEAIKPMIYGALTEPSR